MDDTTTEISYVVRSVYGKDNMYIVSQHAEAIARLTGKKTIDNADMQSLSALGFTFKQVLS